MADKDQDLVKRLENFKSLAEHLKAVAVQGAARDSNQAAVERISALIGVGRINTSMLGRYLSGKQSAEVKPTTYLAMAEFLLKAEPKAWGLTIEDSLTKVYDWLEYGSEGAPPNAPSDRHRWRPTAEAIGSTQSVSVEELRQKLPDLTIYEKSAILAMVADDLQSRLADASLWSEATPAPQPEPEPPCNDDNPLSSLLYISIDQERPTSEVGRVTAIKTLAERSRLSEERCRAILCGDAPNDAEIDALATVVRMPPNHLAMLIGRFR